MTITEAVVYVITTAQENSFLHFKILHKKTASGLLFFGFLKNIFHI